MTYLEALKLAGRNPRPTLVAAGSHIITPSANTGAGHITPGRALSQQLQRMAPESGVNFHSALAHTDTNTWQPKFKSTSGQEIAPPSGSALHPDVAVTTGFANVPGSQAYEHIDPEQRAKMPEIRPTKLIHGVPDMDPDMPLSERLRHAPVGVLHPAAAAALTKSRYGDSIRYGYGRQRPGTVLSLEHSPYMTDEALLAAHNSLAEKPGAGHRIILSALAKQDPALAKSFHAFTSNTRAEPVFISGSGRGDYTYSRAMAAARQNPDRPIVVALGAHGEAMLKAMGGRLPPNVFPLRTGNAPIPQPTYMAMRGGVGASLGATSGAEYSESLMLPSRNVILEHANTLKDVEQGILRGNASDKLLNEHAAVNLPVWNRGQILHAKHERPTGVHVVDNPDSIEEALSKTLRNDSDDAVRRRAEQHLRGAQLARENAADFLLKQTHDTWKKTSELSPQAKLANFKGTMLGASVPAILLTVPGALLGAAGAGTAAAVRGDDVLPAAGRGALLGGSLGAAAGLGIGASTVAKSASWREVLNRTGKSVADHSSYANAAIRGSLGGAAVGSAAGAIDAGLEDQDISEGALAGAGAGLGVGLTGGLGLRAYRGRASALSRNTDPDYRANVKRWTNNIQEGARALPTSVSAAASNAPSLDELLAAAEVEAKERSTRLNGLRGSLGF